MLKRRRFIKNSATISVASLLLPADLFEQKKLIEKIGIPFFSLPKLLEKEFAGTLTMLSKMGYKEVELYGPYPFSTEATQKRWDSVTPALGFKDSGYFGHSVSIDYLVSL